MFDILMEQDRRTAHDPESPVRWQGDDLLDLHLEPDPRAFAFTRPPAFVVGVLPIVVAPQSRTRAILAQMRLESGLVPHGRAA